MYNFQTEESDQAMKKMRETIDPFGIFAANQEVQRAWLTHPQQMSELVSKLAVDWWKLQTHAAQRLMGVGEADAVPSVEGDERFTDAVWTENPLYDILKEEYLFLTRNLVDAYYDAPEANERQKHRAAFWAKQVMNILAPTNYFWLNPIAIGKYLESGGESLKNGLKNWSRDMVSGGDIKMVDEAPFHVGGNLANTPGAVVFRNELLEVIQYQPTTPEVHAVPLVIVSPWINKYYILDLNEEMSMVRFLVNKGFTVFITSWKNPTREMRDTTFEDYVLKGVWSAVQVAQEISGSAQVHLAGYCIGGTAVSSLMAWLKKEFARKGKFPVASWTLFASLVDFANPGEIDVFIDEDIIPTLEEMMENDGYLDSKALMRTFRLLRSNSLIWRYFVHNYLYGETPPPIPVLYWNTDGTRLPKAMHKFYLEELYLHNKLASKDALTMGGHKLDLGRIKQPLYIIGTEEDHITPWKQTFHICEKTAGPVRYTLASSGHILGIINPPARAAKRKYWTGEAQGETDATAWLATRETCTGSWWDDWTGWLSGFCGPMKPATDVGSPAHPRLCAAPGLYVAEH